MASRWSARCANNGSGPSVAAGSARTRAGRLLTGDAATRAERASLSLWPVPGGRSPSMSATAVAAAQLAINVASSAGPSCAASGLGDAARPATSPSRSPSSLIRRSSLDSCVSSDQALHAARPLGNFGDREWGISVIRSTDCTVEHTGSDFGRRTPPRPGRRSGRGRRRTGPHWPADVTSVTASRADEAQTADGALGRRWHAYPCRIGRASQPLHCGGTTHPRACSGAIHRR
jgi:hypothetical protein